MSSQLDLFILQWEEVPGSGFDLTVLDPSDRKGTDTYVSLLLWINRKVNKRSTKCEKLVGIGSVMDDYVRCDSSCNSYNIGYDNPQVYGIVAASCDK